MEHALPRTWSLCMTSENHGTVGPAGCTFSHAPEKHERVLVVEVPAAANKAAEEGELPKMPALPDAWMRLSEEEGSDDYPVFINGQMHAYAREYARAAIAADRAARPVANKAEVDLSNVARYSVGVERCTMDRDDNDGEWVKLRDFEHFIYDNSTPPATTGASTLLTARGAGQYYAKGSAWSDAVADAATTGSNVVGDGVTISNGSTYSMTKRWDGSAWQTMEAILDGNLLVTGLIHGSVLKVGPLQIRKPDGTLILGAGGTLAAEVAAQAGQVEVPGWISIDATEPPEHELIALRYWPYGNSENPQAVTGGRYIDGTYYNDEGDEMHPPSHWCRLPYFDAEATAKASTSGERQEGGA
jgi:hypothetical protein